jgi:hypothetical protein
MEIRDARKLSPKAQDSIRVRAVRAVLGGKSQVEVAAIFGVSREAVGALIERKFGVRLAPSTVGPLPPVVGLLPAEANPQGLRAESDPDPLLAADEIPGDPAAGQGTRRPDLLGR